MRQIIMIVLIVFLYGCSTKNYDSHKYATQAHQKKTVVSDSAKFPAYSAVADANGGASSTQINAYMREGILLTRTHCLDTVRSIAENNRNLKYSKEQFLIGTVLATGLMAINGASSSSFERLALGSAFLVSTADLYQNYFLLGPNAPEVIDFIERALDAQQTHAFSTTPTDFVDASQRIYDYATVCSSVNVNKLVSEALDKAKFEVPQAPSEQLKVMQQLATALGVVAISNEELVALWSIAMNPALIDDSNDEATKVINQRLGTSKAKAQITQIQQICFNQPSSISSSLATAANTAAINKSYNSIQIALPTITTKGTVKVVE